TDRTLSFPDGATTICSHLALNATRHPYTTPFRSSVGGHTITATYSGDASFSGSNGSVAQTVNQDGTTTSVVTSGSPSVFGQSVSFEEHTSELQSRETIVCGGTLGYNDGATTIGSN